MTDQQTTPDFPASAQSNEATPPASLLGGFWRELKRRHVIRVATVYAIVAWLVIQVASTTFEGFGIPEWAFRFVVLLLLLGLPISLVIAWALELTPNGIQLTQRANHESAASADIMRKRSWFSMVFAATVPTLIFGTLALVFYLRGGDTPSVDTPVPNRAEQSIAVLPLTNMSANPENAFFAGGMHEDILTNLSRIHGLKVISRTSALRYINSELSVRDIGAALGARYIVEGSVRRVNNHVRVTVQLIDAPADTHLWANNYDRELLDVFATQSAVAKEISNSLHLELQPETVGTLQGMPTHSVKAYDFYIKARSIDRSEHQSESSLTRQRQLLEAALDEDPDFVEAWAFLNEVLDTSLETLTRLGWFVPEGGNRQAIYDDFYQASVLALKKAVALSPDNVETLIARASGTVGEEELVENADANNRALRKKMMDYTLEKYPESAMAWYILGWWHNFIDSDSEATRMAFKKALELDPLHARIVEGSLASFRMAGNQEMVTMLFERLAQISPDKGKDRSLARVSTMDKLRNLVFAFARTADQTFIDAYSDEMAKDDVFFKYEHQELLYKAELAELNNNFPALLEMQSTLVLTADTDERAVDAYLVEGLILLTAQQLAGHTDKARQIAQRIIEFETLPNLCSGNQTPFNGLVFTTAYAALGESAKAQQWFDKLSDGQSSCYADWEGFRLTALGLFDIDRAVKMSLDLHAREPQHQLTDFLAVFHLRFRHMLVHPDMQAYYVKEDKWIDYLAERVPEYKQYRN